jgi:hypothetical protein
MFYMKPFQTLGVAALIAAGAVAFSPAPAPAYSSPITILSCTIAKPKAMSQKAGGTDISFINHGPKTAKEIKFAVGYVNSANPHGLYRSVVDDGTFSPGVTIKHHYSLYNDVTYSGANTKACGAVKVTWSDGTVWVASR